MNAFLSPRLLDAVSLAVAIHSPMKRKGDDLPYIIHPIAVLALLSRWNADENTCIAGLLHDVLEDVPEEEKEHYRRETLQRFGSDVLEIVESVTEQDKSLPWKERKKKYLEHLKTASHSSLLVSCADLSHNIATLADAYEKDGEEVWERFNAIKQWKVWFIDQRTEILNKRLPEERMIELRSHLRDLNKLLSQPVPSEHLSVLPNNGKKETLMIMDPLYQVLWDHCLLTEQEMEEGMLEDTRETLQ